MKYTDDNRQIMHFRLMEQVNSSWRRLAIGLKFPQHRIATIEEKDDPVYYLLSEWLRGANQGIDLRPITWESLIASLRDANLQLEADTLENHLIQIETASSAVSRVGELTTITTRVCIGAILFLGHPYISGMLRQAHNY